MPTTGVKAATFLAIKDRKIPVDGFTLSEMYTALSAVFTELQIANSLNQSYARGELKRTGNNGHFLYAREPNPPVRSRKCKPEDPLETLLTAIQAAVPEIKKLIRLRKLLQETT